ncbi:MAG: Autotransporter adhesin, partial [candidate division TM6 bacterium GW2011_GWF2_32_72]
TDTGLLSTSTISLQNQLDQVMTDTTNLQDQIDLFTTSTINLQNQIDAVATDTGLLSTSTISLQNQLDQVMTDTTNLQDQIDLFTTSTINLQNQIDAVATDTGLLSTSTISLQNQLDQVMTDTTNLQDQIDLFTTSTINLQNQIDAVATDTGLLSTSTISLQNQLDQVMTDTTNLQDQIDLFTTSTINLQNQIDAVATDTGLLSTSTISLQDQILDLNATSTEINGGTFVRYASGAIIECLVVSGSGNTLAGQPVFGGDITLVDQNTELIIAVQSSISQNIVMNNGTVILNDDLKFVGDKAFTGSGIINANNRLIEFGGDLNLTSSVIIANSSGIRLGGTTQLSSIMTLTSNNVIIGDENILDLGTTGQIIVGSGSNLVIRDTIVKNISGNNIQCYSGSTITLQNSTWILDANYSFTAGALEIQDNFEIKGSYTLAYQTIETSSILPYSTLILDNGLTFSYDPISSSSQLLGFIDETSMLILDGATLHTVTNLELIRGTLGILRNSYLSSEASDPFDAEQGIFFGDLVNDMFCQIVPGVHLILTQGNLVNKNLIISSWNLPVASSVLNIGSNSSLILETDLDLGLGVVQFGDGAYLKRIGGADLVSSVNLDGALTYSIIS